MDASRLLEIRMREASNIVNKSQQSDSSLRTFRIVAQAVGCGTADSRVPTTGAVIMKNVGCNTYVPATGVGKQQIEVCCGQTPLPVAGPQPALPCLCVEARRFVGAPCGCGRGN